MTMMISDRTAPAIGFTNEVVVTNPMRNVRKAFSAASTAPNGLSRISTLMTCPTSHTSTNAAIASGTINTLSSALKSMVANPARQIGWPTAAEPPDELCPKIEAMIGTNAPAATRPLILFSMASATSSGFFNPGGITVPNESFAATAPTSNSAGNQKCGRAYHGNLSFRSFGVVKYSYAPTALVPNSGDIATPVIFAMAFAASGSFGGGAAGSARAAGIEERSATPNNSHVQNRV